MKYINANQIFPQELLEKLQEYVQGEYIYIPKKDKKKSVSVTDYKVEIDKRNAHLYTKYLEGVCNSQLAKMYNLSESSIRRIIIKQRGCYNTMKERIKTILVHWDISSVEIKQIYDTAWQIGDAHILKVYKDRKRLQRNIKILQILETMQIPVGRVLASKDKELYVTDGEHHFLLTERLLGSNIVTINDYSGIGILMGETIGNLHMAFRECEKQELFWNNSLLEEMKGWVREVFEKNCWSGISEEMYNSIVQILAQHYEELPVQLIHRDVHFGNFLFDNGIFSGYIDFDLSQRNIRIFDLCYFLLGLLSEEEKIEITKEEWFRFATDVFVGYEKIIPLSDKEKEMVPCVMECIELLFAAYFRKIDDVVCAENALRIFEFVRSSSDVLLSYIIGD